MQEIHLITPIALDAAMCDRLDTLVWLMNWGLKVDQSIYEAAITGGSLSVLKWLKDKHDMVVNEKTFSRAASLGYTHILQWLREIGCPADEQASVLAIANDRIVVYEWLDYHNYPRGRDTMIEAIKRGHHWIVKDLLAEGIKVDNITVAISIEYGNLKSLKKMSKVVVIQDGHINRAVVSGHVSILGWLREEGYRFDEGHSILAAETNAVSTLQWMKDRGYEISDEACRAAASKRQIGALKWLVENRCRGYELYL